MRSLLASIARTIWRSSSTLSTAALRKSSFWRRISELAYSAPVGVISASPSVTVRKPSSCAASTIGSRSSISKREIVRQAVDVVLAVVVQQQLQQAGDAARPRVRQLLVMHLPLVADGLARRRAGQRRRLRVGLGQHLVDVVHQLRKRRRLAVARMLQRHLEVRAHMPGIAPQHDDAVRQQHRLFDVVGHQKDRLGRNRLLLPQLQQFAAQVLRRQHVERGERLVHEQHLRLDHQRARKSDPLPHAARELLRIGRLEAVQTDRVEDLHAAPALLRRLHPARLQRRFDVFQHGQPGEQREALEDDRDVRLGRRDRLFVPVHLARRRRGKPGQHTQQGRFARA